MTFSIFGLTGTAYGLAAGVSALAYLGVAVWCGRKTYAGALLLYGVLGIPMGLFVSRLFFFAVNFTQLLVQPAYLFMFWTDGYSMMGLLAGLTLAAMLTAKIRKLDFRAFLDAVTLPMGVLIFGLRLAEGFTGTLGIGRNVDVPTGALPFLFVTETMGVLELHRLAVYRYEAAFALLIFGLMLWLGRKERKAGDLSMLFFALYGAGQVLFESMRDDGHMVLGFIRVQQVLGLLCPLIVLGVLSRRWEKGNGARSAVTAAWTLLPVAALILWMMVSPINHVLDLSGKIPLGIGLLAPLGVYLAFFLRIKGAALRPVAAWLAALLAMVSCVLLEFSMDGSASLARDYTLLALCCAILFLIPCALYRALKRQEAA